MSAPFCVDGLAVASAERYRADGRKITLVGINFSSERREIAGWKAEDF